jgi:hypothetical protein
MSLIGDCRLELTFNAELMKHISPLVDSGQCDTEIFDEVSGFYKGSFSKEEVIKTIVAYKKIKTWAHKKQDQFGEFKEEKTSQEPKSYLNKRVKSCSSISYDGVRLYSLATSRSCERIIRNSSCLEDEDGVRYTPLSKRIISIELDDENACC